MSTPSAGRFPWCRIRAVLLALSTLVSAGCADLQALPQDQCGNGVVEPDVHESCDGEDNCGRPGAAHACRFVCDPATKKGCPDGYGCGVDGECRRPSGSFEPLSSFSAPTVLDLFAGDTDGDGCSELVHTTRRGTAVTAFDSRPLGHCAASSQEISIGADSALSTDPTPPSPFLADISADGRADLLMAGTGLFGDGLYVNLDEGASAFEPLLYPTVRAQQGDAKPLRVKYAGQDTLLLLLGDAPDDGSPDCPDGTGGAGGGTGGPPAGGLGVAWVSAPTKRPVGLAGLPGTLADLLFAEAVDLDGEPECEEILIGVAGEPRIHVFGFQTCGAPKPALQEIGAVELDSGAKLRARNASLGVADFDGDGHPDLLVNATDATLHLAYNDGAGGFQSKPPGQGPFDHATGPFTPVVAAGAPDPAAAEQRFVVADFVPESPGPEIVGLPCPEAMEFRSPVCGAFSGSCESVVTDIDADGRLDVVSTAEQEPGIVVQRGLAGGGFHATSLDTTCPPHEIVPADLDGDGVSDLAFFDQVAATSPLTGEPRGVTALSIAYGRAYSSPEPPVTSAVFELASGLTAGELAAGTPGRQLYATRRIQCEPLGSGAALVEGQTARLPVAPFYFPTDKDDMSGDNLRSLRFVATASGRFFPGGGGSSEIGVAVLTRDLTDGAETAGSERLSLVAGHAGASSLQPLTIASTEVPACDGCALAAIDADGAGVEELLLLGAEQAYLYEVVTAEDGEVEGFAVRATFPTKASFSSVDGASNPVKYAPRPIVADLDGDGSKDVLLRATTGALVAFWGAKDGSFEEKELSPTPCAEGEICAGLSAALLEVDGDAAREALVIGPGQMAFYDLDPASRTLIPIAVTDELGLIRPPPADTDLALVASGDFDGDGVDDIAHASVSSFLTILRGVPATE